MLSDETKTRSQLLDEVRKLRRRVGELQDRAHEHERAVEALRTSEARFRAIHEHAPIMIDGFDVDGRCVLWNRECERTFGWTMEELNAQDDPLAVFYPNPQVRNEVLMSVTSTPGEAFREWRPLTKNGEERVTLWANFRLPDGTVINVGQDITEGKRSEEALRTYREHLEQLVDERTAELRRVNASLEQEVAERKQAEDALRREKLLSERLIANSFDGILAFDRSCVITLWNAGMERISRTKAEDVIGRYAFDAFPFLKEIGEDRFYYDALDGKTVVAGGRPYVVADTGEQGLFEGAYSPLRNESGEVIGGVAFIRDITERKITEEELRQKEYIIESASNAIATADLDGGMTYVNPAFLETWGFDDLDEVWGRPFPEFWMVEERLDEIMNALRDKRKWADEVQARKKDGTLFDVQVSAAMVHDNQGRPIGMMSSSVDITERKRAQRALRDSEQTVRALVETSRDWIWSIDLNATHTYCNPAVEAILGYRPDELVGRRSLELMHDDDRRAIEERLPGWIAQAQGWSNLFIRWRHKDGSWRFLESSAVPILDAAGRLRGFRGVDRDTTDRKRAEERLRESEAKLRAILDYSPALISTKDLDGTITLVNRRFEVLAGPTPDEFVGRNASDLFPPDVAAELWKNDLAAREGPVEAEETVQHRDGTHHTYLTVKFPLTDKDGDLLGTCAISTDITERKRNEEERLNLERQIQHAQKLESLGVMAGGIAHDFNNLLYVILGSAELALHDLSPVSPVRPLIEEVEKAARRAAALTRQMLAYSGRGKFEIKELNLSELAEEMAQLIRSSIPKNVAMEMDLREDVPNIKADVAQVQQVVMNLITNAAEAIGKEQNGTVRVSTGAMDCSQGYLSRSRVPERPEAGRFAYVEVGDSGCGMNEETREKLFDPFFTTKFTGHGLGMSAVLGIARGHRGAIMVDSEPGEGTTIKVLFPALDESEGSVVGGDVGRQAADWSGRGTVLLADDEESVRNLAKRMLERMGFDVLVASDGREAVEIFSQHSDEIVGVLLDLSMPHMDGEQASRELRRQKADVRVILSSGYAEQEIEERLAGHGIAAFIQKPYRWETLREKLRPVLAT